MTIVRKGRARLIILAIIASGCHATAPSRPVDGVIVGRIFDGADSSGLAQVTVAISETRFSTTSRTSGTFALRYSSSGLQSIVLNRRGYHPFTLPPLNLSSGDTIRLTATLQNAAKPLPAPRVCAESLLFGRDCHNPLFHRGNDPLLIIDGVIMMQDDPSLTASTPDPRLKPVATIDFTMGDDAIRMYGQRALTGVISVTTKRQVSGRESRLD